ncbi:MAG TPA: organomercurial lyase [Anaerolineales bacterium]|nr:organomercurial lyase [Anaerolineales bacterium]
MTDDSLLWQVRHFVYNHFADTTQPPSVEDTALHFNISTEEASELHRQLHHRHAIFLEPGTSTIRMANPFSGIPTDFKVHANGMTYYASCAWDMLGIPAALHTDAVIEAVYTESNESVQLEVKNGQITTNHSDDVTLSASEGSLPPKRETLPGTCARGKCRSQQPLPQSDMLLVHFPLPFARWYDDLVFT